MLLVLASAVVFTAAAWLLLGLALAGHWSFSLPSGASTRVEATRLALTITAGAAAAVALVVAYRRQRHLEDGAFLERLATAARQLGDREPTVQFSGVYALAALADESTAARRQQSVDVLCGYLRLPYSPQSHRSLLDRVVRTQSWINATGQVEEARTYLARPADREIRLTIIRLITQHLREGARVSWSDLSLDFTGAVFDGGDFSNAVFAGTATYFTRAEFTGDVSFAKATFATGAVSFERAVFEGGEVSFDQATFEGGDVSFASARFAGGTVDFHRVSFAGSEVRFDFADFTRGVLGFVFAEFTAGRVSFFSAQVSGGSLDFTAAKFRGSEVTFHGASFFGGAVLFDGAELSAGKVSFADVYAYGGLLSFRYIRGSGSGVLDVTRPNAWDAEVAVEWDPSTVPSWVEPRQWPPEGAK